MTLLHTILPVFAGMILPRVEAVGAAYYSPRIRGDDPLIRGHGVVHREFSPYSRG